MPMKMQTPFALKPPGVAIHARVHSCGAPPLQGGLSMAVHLRVFPETHESSFDGYQDPSVRVSLRDLLPLIAMAKRQKYLWVNDFLDDEIRITPDLYEVVRAFTSCRRPSA
jgi:hypothetical protein